MPIHFEKAIFLKLPDNLSHWQWSDTLLQKWIKSKKQLLITYHSLVVKSTISTPSATYIKLWWSTSTLWQTTKRCRFESVTLDGLELAEETKSLEHTETCLPLISCTDTKTQHRTLGYDCSLTRQLLVVAGFITIPSPSFIINPLK